MSCLWIFNSQYEIGLLASGFDDYLEEPQGSTPWTDPLLGSDAFRIVHDGAGYTRMQKIDSLLSWESALPFIRVCFERKGVKINCGKCEKCIRTILSFRVVGAGLPSCFSGDITINQIKALSIKDSLRLE